MNLLKNLKVSKKLLLAFGTVLSLFVISVIIAVVSLLSVSNQLMTFYKGPYANTNRAYTIQYELNSTAKNMLHACLTTDTSVVKTRLGLASDSTKEINQKVSELKANFRGDISLVNEIETATNGITDSFDLFSQYCNANDIPGAFKIYEDEILPNLAVVDTNIKRVLQNAENSAVTMYEGGESTSLRSIVIMIVIGILSTFIGIAMAVIITRMLVKGINDLKNSALQMAEGDFDCNITYESKDELGVLSNSMRSMIQMIKTVIDDTNRLLSGMASGDFTVRTEAEKYYIGNFQTLLGSIQKLNQDLNTTLIQINQSSEQVANGSNQVSSGSQALSQGATEQASSIEELSASINEISEQVKENANNALQANNKSMQVGEEITQSKAQMDSMIEAMADITTRSQEIQKIIKAIDDIAFQTNILALNAAVEAARAGAAGKGFAVVADEVRSLASKSAEAAKNTATLIEASIEAVGKGTQIADETAKSLVMVVEGSQEVSETVNRIAMASNEQATSISQVTQGVEQISAVVQTNSATAEESAAASEELNSQAQLLKEIVSKFTLNKDGDSGSIPTHSRAVASSSIISTDGSKY